MSVKYWMVPVVMLLMAGCTTKNEVTVTGDDSSSLQSSPAGVATNSFIDLEGGIGYKLDALPTKVLLPGGQASTMQLAYLPSCVVVSPPSGDTVLLTFGAGCKGANGWDLTGTVSYDHVASSSLHDVTFDLILTDPTATKTWTYTGTKHVTVTATTATVTVSPAAYLTVVYADTTDTSKNKAYHYTPDLHADWTTPGTLTIYGSYSFQQIEPAGATITAAVAVTDPLFWPVGCCYPTSGTINLTATTGPAVAKANAVFGPACTALKLNGNSITLASCN